MFSARRGLILAALAVVPGTISPVTTISRFWYVGGIDGSVALTYAGDSVWVFASSPEGPFAFHASTAAMGAWADSAPSKTVRFAYHDPSVGRDIVVELTRFGADSAPLHQCTVRLGGYMAGVTFSVDSAQRLFSLLHGRPSVASPVSASTEETFFNFQVEKQAGPTAASGLPAYPEPLRVANVEGMALAQFVVDTMGLAEVSTFKILHSTDPWFTSAVYGVLPRLRLTPAEIKGRKVRELVQEPFAFNLRHR
jgi:hypothetical protein